MDQQINEHIKLIQEVDQKQIVKLAEIIRTQIRGGKKVLIFGNGGSAADAQHFAAELIGRFKKERSAIPAIALTTDTSILTAIGNDYGFDFIFSRQVEALAKDGDIVIAISTSGNSKNVYGALLAARLQGCYTILLTGDNAESPCAKESELSVFVNSKNTARIQEVHITILHLIAEFVEQ
jgi:D-sedoheptulose 7-phosphate isomerase